MRTRILGAAAATVAVFAAAGAPAVADTIGQADPPAGALHGYCGGQQPEAVSFTPIPRAGVLTQFRYRSLADGVVRPGTLQVIRHRPATVQPPTPSNPSGFVPEDYLVVGRVPAPEVNNGSLVRVAAAIPVQQGDLIGIYGSGDFAHGFPCNRRGDSDDQRVGLPFPQPVAEPAPGESIIGPSDNPFQRQLAALYPSVLNLEATVVQDGGVVDSHSAAKTTGPVFTSNGALPSGTVTTVVVQGTDSSFAPSLMAGTPGSYWGICGVPEAGPMFPSPGIVNGRVGADPQYLFSFPQKGFKCSAANQAALPKRQSALRFSTDGGATWFTPSAQEPKMTADHRYTYAVAGQGQPLKVMVPDSAYDDNSGQFSIAIDAQQGASS